MVGVNLESKTILVVALKAKWKAKLEKYKNLKKRTLKKLRTFSFIFGSKQSSRF